MKTEQRTRLEERARVHAALGDPTRLAIVDRLVLGDTSPAALGLGLAIPSNLLTHHLNRLEDAGIIERRRSEGDGRRTYLHLRADWLTGFAATTTLAAERVVFVCTQNSARSQLAEALWRRSSTMPVASAGTEPARSVHPRARSVARTNGLSLRGARTRRFEDVLAPGDLVIAVCDSAHERLRERAPDHLHWSVPDPVRLDTAEAFERAFSDISGRIERLAPAISKN